MEHTLNVLIEGYDASKVQGAAAVDHWRPIYESRQNQTILQAEVLGMENKVYQKTPLKEKLCALVEIGNIRGMIPIDFLGVEDNKTADDPKRIERNARLLIGEKVAFVVIGLDRENDYFVGSRIEALKQMAEHTLKRLAEGDKTLAVVRQVFNNNIIVDVGGIKSSISASEVSYGWVDSMHDLFKNGDHIEVKVIEINKKERTVKLSRKALLENPWNNVHSHFKEKGEYIGYVSGTVEFGTYVTLRDGISGLAQHLRHETLQKGDKVLVRCVKINQSEQKMNLKIMKLF